MSKVLTRTFSGRKSKIYEDIEFSCTIRFLDDSDPLSITYQKQDTGQWLMDRVCKELNLEEKDYFGLRFVDVEKQREKDGSENSSTGNAKEDGSDKPNPVGNPLPTAKNSVKPIKHWLDPLKPLHKQLKQVSPAVLCFRVKFYPSEPLKLKEEITRYFLFLQLRRDLHHGRLLCSPQDANLLAANIIQSEEGDYDEEEHQAGYVSKHKMLPKQTNKQEDKIAEIHKGQLSGQTPAESEANFISKASSLDTYGVDPHPVKESLLPPGEFRPRFKRVSPQYYFNRRNRVDTKATSFPNLDQKGNQMYLGVTHLGIVTFQGNKRTHLFKWPQITKIAFEGKMFIVHVTISEDSENSLLVKKKKHACGFKCPTFAACKHLWKCAVEQQYFFTLERSAEAPKVTSGGGFFSRGSKFRFSGRCQREVFTESAKINRLEPNFVRSCSNPTLVKSYNKHRSESLPNRLKEHALNNSNLSGDNSMQSLTHGEMNFPNGNVSKDEVSMEQGLPDETPKQVSEAPYRPFRSPSREDLPAEPIPEVDGETEGAEDEVLMVVKQLEAELTEQAPPTDPLITDKLANQQQEGGASPQATANQEPCEPEIVPDLQHPVDQASPDQTPPVERPEEVDASSPDSEATRAEPSGDVPTTVSTPPPPGSGLRFCRILTLTFLLMFTVMGVVAVFVLESELDMPVLRDIRQMPEVQDFKHHHYNRLKTTVAQRMGGWFK